MNTDSDSFGQLSKHYYAGTERIASRLAGPAAAFAEAEDPEGAHVEALPALQRMDIRMPLHGWGIGFDDPSFANDTLPEDNCSLYPPGSEEHKQCLCDQEADCPNVVYWYHPDHLGSSTFLTDAAGEPYQFVMYLPFGETFTEQRAAGFGTPYLFNAKELDAETGLYYYGARYGACPDKLIGNPRISTWWGVDPMAGEMPAWSSYAYTFQNPVRFMDPTGMVPEEGGDPPGSKPFEVVVTASRLNKKAEDPIKGISQAFGAVPDLAKVFAKNVGAILPSGPKNVERDPSFGYLNVQVNGGVQWSLQDGKGGDSRFSSNADVGPSLDILLAAFGAVKATGSNPHNPGPFSLQYIADAVQIGASFEKPDTLIIQFISIKGTRDYIRDTVYDTKRKK